MYLDFAATNKISQIWIDSIIHSNSKNLFGNPGSYHKAGFEALDMMENSTKNILNDIFEDKEIANQYDICYNSGSTESINQFIYAMSKQQDVLVVYENVAHKAVLKSVQKYFPEDNFKLDFSLTVEDNLKNLKEFLEKSQKYYKRCLLVLTSVNNETGGIINPEIIGKIDNIFKDYREISTYAGERLIDVFIDHTQGFMKNNEIVHLADAFCFSAHKIGGMKGFGGLVYKKEYERILKENPLIVGGYEIRGGTKDPISVKALDDLVDDKYIRRIISGDTIVHLHNVIVWKLQEIANEYKIELTFNKHSDFYMKDQSPYIINASFVGIEGESLMSSLIDDCISTGSACNSSELKTSHVLSGMGIKKLIANCAFRISIDETVNEEELKDFLDNRFKPAIKFLARMRTRHGEE